jgi:FMN phosphatase YigB (HAD superfamily)
LKAQCSGRTSPARSPTRHYAYATLGVKAYFDAAGGLTDPLAAACPMKMTKPRKTVLITDCDNTLYDWVDIWYRSFAPMLDVLVAQSGVAREKLVLEIKQVHQKHRTSEYAFLIEELPCLKSLYPHDDLTIVYADAIAAFEDGRRASLRLYPTVLETLTAIKASGTLIIAYTDSMAFYSIYRIGKLGLDGVLDALYSPPDHDLPERVDPNYSKVGNGLLRTAHRHIPPGEVKPNPRVLLDIIADLSTTSSSCVYVGDSLVKDISMANEADVASVHAKYGEAHRREEYELLKAVTHWHDAQVNQEQQGVTAVPTCVINETFGEIMDHYEFVRA